MGVRSAPRGTFSGGMLADLGFLMALASAEDRLRDPDPEQLGVQRMGALLALVNEK